MFMVNIMITGRRCVDKGKHCVWLVGYGCCNRKLSCRPAGGVGLDTYYQCI